MTYDRCPNNLTRYKAVIMTDNDQTEHTAHHDDLAVRCSPQPPCRISLAALKHLIEKGSLCIVEKHEQLEDDVQPIVIQGIHESAMGFASFVRIMAKHTN